MAIEASSVPAATKADDFARWLPRYLDLRVAKKREGGRWFVLIANFDITGVGETSDDALDEAFSLLNAYLRAHFEDGTPFEQTLRPIPRRMRAAIHIATAISRLLPVERRPSERHALVSPSTLLHAGC